MSWSNLRYLPGQIGLALLVFGLWEGLVRAEVLSAHLYGYPSGIAAKVWGLLSTGELFRHAGVTAFAAFVGFVLGSAGYEVPQRSRGLFLAAVRAAPQFINKSR